MQKMLSESLKGVILKIEEWNPGGTGQALIFSLGFFLGSSKNLDAEAAPQTDYIRISGGWTQASKFLKLLS